MNFSIKQTPDIENNLVVAKEEWRWGRVGFGIWDQQMQTIIYRMDKQQGPTVQHRKLYIQYPVINHNEKEFFQYF